MISDTIRYVGVNDHVIDLFEGQYPVPNGMAYNSYVILDTAVAVMDSVDAAFGDAWLKNLQSVLGDRAPDYLIVQHMEPDHSASVMRFTETYPDATVVASAKAFAMMEQFFGTLPARTKTIAEGDTLPLGEHELTFIAAPMVHWPEVMLSYEIKEATLFSADAFGKFGALDVEEEWDCEARRYYFGIVGKYGAQVQKLLQKAAALPIARICPLHGPVLEGDLSHYFDLYTTWSGYQAESRGAVIAYASMYGNTKAAALELAALLRQKGCAHVVLHDLARTDIFEAVEDAFRYDTLVLASPTYNMSLFPVVHAFLIHLTERGYRNRRIGLIENGSWAPAAAKRMRELLEPCAELSFAEPTVTLRSALTAESRAALTALATALIAP